MKKKDKIEKQIIETCVKIGQRGEGAIIVLGNTNYAEMVEQNVKKFNIIRNPKLFESLCLMDGAVILDLNGNLKAYGCKLDNGMGILKNFGMRHSSAMYSSLKGETTVFIVSEEDRKVRIFKKGKMILEIDPLVKGIEKKTTEISKILESVGLGTITGASVIGMGVLAPVIGITVISGITIFVVTTGVSYVIKKLDDWGMLRGNDK